MDTTTTFYPQTTMSITSAPTDSPEYRENPNNVQVSVQTPYKNPYISYVIIGIAILILLIIAFMVLKA